jgi:chemotaxis protein histidine kinase CheA
MCNYIIVIVFKLLLQCTHLKCILNHIKQTAMHTYILPAHNPMTAANDLVDAIVKELRQSLEPKILQLFADHQLFKETHQAVLQIPFVKHLLENQCKCTPPSTHANDQIHLEIIDIEPNPRETPNLDSIVEYIDAANKGAETDEAEEEEEAIQEAEEEAEEAEEAEAEAEEEEKAEEAEEAEEAEAEAEAEEEEAEEEEEEAEEEEEEEAEEEEEEAIQDEEEEAKEEEAADEAIQEAKEEEEEEAIQEEKESEEAIQEEEAEDEAIQEEEESEEAIQKEEAEDEAIQEAEPVQENANEVQEEEADEEEELELFEVEIKGKTYVTNDETDGDIYAYVNEEVGEIVGAFKSGVAKFTKKSKTKSA